MPEIRSKLVTAIFSSQKCSNLIWSCRRGEMSYEWVVGEVHYFLNFVEQVGYRTSEPMSKHCQRNEMSDYWDFRLVSCRTSEVSYKRVVGPNGLFEMWVVWQMRCHTSGLSDKCTIFTILLETGLSNKWHVTI